MPKPAAHIGADKPRRPVSNTEGRRSLRIGHQLGHRPNTSGESGAGQGLCRYRREWVHVCLQFPPSAAPSKTNRAARLVLRLPPRGAERLASRFVLLFVFVLTLRVLGFPSGQSGPLLIALCADPSFVCHRPRVLSLPTLVIESDHFIECDSVFHCWFGLRTHLSPP